METEGSLLSSKNVIILTPLHF